MLIFKLFGESLRFAFLALRQNKLRTFLSLFGITIGIITIIGVFSAVDTFRNYLQSSVDKLGGNTIYIQKWPWQFGGDYPWWKYTNRPDPSLKDYEKLVQRLNGAAGISYEIGMGNKIVKHRNSSIEGAQVTAATHDYYQTRNFDIALGRYFTDAESRAGNAAAIIGSAIADGLFGAQDPIGKSIYVLGRKVNVVGVFKEEGEDMLGISADKTVLLPLNFARNVVNIDNGNYGPMITVRGMDNMPLPQLESELTGLMRSIHRLGPREEADFALNKSTILTAGLDQMFIIVNLAGGAIGIFSILVGGFGIANIMFVSVKERTNMIGIQKSLGAKNYFILLQFLIESVILCVMGGIIGMALVYALAFVFKVMADLTIVVNLDKVILMFGLSTTIGLISGIIPALMASRLDPVEAIRSQ